MYEKSKRESRRNKRKKLSKSNECIDEEDLAKMDPKKNEESISKRKTRWTIFL